MNITKMKINKDNKLYYACDKNTKLIVYKIRRKLKQDTKLINTINKKVKIVKGEFALKKEIKEREDIGYLFKNIYINGKFLSESLWIYKPEMTKELLENINLTVGEPYYIKGEVRNIKRYTEEGKCNRFAFKIVTDISKNLQISTKGKYKKKQRKIIKKKSNLKKCPRCGSLNIQKVHRSWYFCESCFEEFQLF